MKIVGKFMEAKCETVVTEIKNGVKKALKDSIIPVVNLTMSINIQKLPPINSKC